MGLLTDETGFPLRAGAFEGNKAETATMIPMINDFMDAYDLDDVIVVADAGMISAANRQALERACLSYVLGSRTSRVPQIVRSEERVPSAGWGLRGQQSRDRHHDPDDQRLHGRPENLSV